MDNKIKHEVENIEIPDELRSRVIMGMEKAYDDSKYNSPNKYSLIKLKNWNFTKKLIYCGATLVLLFTIFFGTAFVFPPVAKVAEKIPYLNSLIKPNTVDFVVFNDLEEKGYKVDSISLIYSPSQTLDIRLGGTTTYYKSVREEIEVEVRKILKSKGYNEELLVKISRAPGGKEDITLNEQQTTEKEKLEEDIAFILERLDYKVQTIEIDPIEKKIYIDIQNSTKKIKGAIENEIDKYLKENNKSYQLNVSNEQTEVVKINKGAQITPTISEKLMTNKEFKVSGVGFKNDPLTFIIKTSINSEDKNSQELAKNIEKEVIDLISDEYATLIDSNSFNIVVRDNKGEKLN